MSPLLKFKNYIYLRVISLCVFTIALIFPWSEACAEFDLQCYLTPGCTQSLGGGRRSSANPSSGGQVKINPSAVPTEKGFGIEGIFFKDQVDVSLVRGLGRVGAAISPSNSEETFFGPPGFEIIPEYFERRLEAKKYPNQKYTLAGAVSLIDKKGSGMRSFSLKLGVMGKYNKFTKNVSPGGGLSGILGPLAFGGSVYTDEGQLNDGDEAILKKPTVIPYYVETYNVGLFLSSVILDYSHLKLKTENDEVSEVTLVTASLMLKKFILTASKRTEDSDRPRYNPFTESMESMRIKNSYFGGVQYTATKNLMVGVLYNYYLLDELSLSATLFF